MDAGNYCSICDRYFSSAYNRKRHVLRKHMDHDDQSNGSDTETVDYSKPVPDCCKLEKSPTLVEAAEDDNMSTTSSHDSHESSSSDDDSDEEDSSNEEMDAEGNKIYKESDLEFARFLIQMKLAFNAHHDVEYTVVNYLKIFYKKFRAFKSSNLCSVLREEMADFKTGHKFASSSETLENALELRRIFIQNLFAQVEEENESD